MPLIPTKDIAPPRLKAGDIFVSQNPMMLGIIINAVQKFWSADNQSEYSHAGIIINPNGETFESLYTIRRSHIDKYTGKKVMIARHTAMTDQLFTHGFSQIIKHDGQIYPYHRLPLFLVPFLAKYISTGLFPVCSELVCKFLVKCGLRENWSGVNPDHIADMMKGRVWMVVFAGLWAA
jgi:hypothetical protein